MRQWTGSALVQIMACCPFGAKPLPYSILTYCWVNIGSGNSLVPAGNMSLPLRNKHQWKSNQNTKPFIQENAFEIGCEMTAILSRRSWVKIRSRTLTHWSLVTHICVSDLISIGSDSGLSPGRRQAIIRTNAVILLLRPLGTMWIFSRNSNIFIQENAFESVICEKAAILFRSQWVKGVQRCP